MHFFVCEKQKATKKNKFCKWFYVYMVLLHVRSVTNQKKQRVEIFQWKRLKLYENINVILFYANFNSKQREIQYQKITPDLCVNCNVVDIPSKWYYCVVFSREYIFQYSCLYRFAFWFYFKTKIKIYWAIRTILFEENSKLEYTGLVI